MNTSAPFVNGWSRKRRRFGSTYRDDEVGPRHPLRSVIGRFAARKRTQNVAAGAAAFVDALEKEGAPARERFIAMLKAGGSDYPYRLYKKAGLDMATTALYEALVTRMSRIMDQIDAIKGQK